jgi:hypothetical protein
MGIIFENGFGIGAAPNTSFLPTFGKWLFAIDSFGYQPAGTNGVFCAPVYNGGFGTNNLNDVLTTFAGDSGIYINEYDAAGNTQYMLQNLLNQSGTITFRQENTDITFAYQSNSFIGGNNYGSIYADYQTAPITVVSTSNRPFVGNSGGTPEDSQLVDIIIHTDATFTVETSMISNLMVAGQTINGSPNGTSGFTVSQAINNLGHGVYGPTINNSSITTAFANVNIATNDNTGYICSVEWGAGSTVSRGYAKVSYVADTGYITIGSVDPSDTNLGNNDNQSDGTSLAGTFNFPATFTLLRPTDAKGGWC